VFTVPDGFFAQFSATDIACRADWLATLPELATGYARRWSLTPDGDPLFGHAGVVWPVRRADGTPAMLKLSWPHDEAFDEGVALRHWAGNGAVRLLEHDGEDYALLLERLDPDRMLHTEPIDEAVEVAGSLLRRLAVPAPPLLRSVRQVAGRWVTELPAESKELGGPVPDGMMAAVVEHCRSLGPRAGTLLVNEDLHYFNVLRGEREPWLVIDPKPIVGDPEWGVIPLLWNRYEETGGAQGIADRFEAIVRTAALDRDRAVAWTLVRAVDNWLWYAGNARFAEAETVAEIASAMFG
jgi:streptomycin 6-kinase